MKEFVSELQDHQFTGKIKIKESEDKEEILTIFIDEDQDKKIEPLVEYKINDKEEIRTIAV